MSLATLVLHPTKPILVTASDDKSWKMWHLPAGDLIMCGEGHKDWVAGVDFHPGGTSLASASGEGVGVCCWCGVAAGPGRVYVGSGIHAMCITSRHALLFCHCLGALPLWCCMDASWTTGAGQGNTAPQLPQLRGKAWSSRLTYACSGTHTDMAACHSNTTDQIKHP
jgi:hypothetical protein